MKEKLLACKSEESKFVRVEMNKKDQIILYLKEKYDPSAVIAYGSFANGTEDEYSDFDALVLTDNPIALHDDSIVNGIELDVFIYSPEHFDGAYDITEIEQIYDGSVLLDKDGLGQKLLQAAADYVASFRPKTMEEKKAEISWCRKMLQRTSRRDPEGYYRWHWLLLDSLEIYCDINNHRYVGPKKSLAWLSESDANGFSLYTTVLESNDASCLRAWIDHLESCLTTSG